MLGLFLVRFGSDSYGFSSVRIVNVRTGKYPESSVLIWIRFGFE